MAHIQLQGFNTIIYTVIPDYSPWQLPLFSKSLYFTICLANAQRFSQRAADLLDGEFGEARQGDGSFEAFFRAAGGQQSFEELESLANDCARLCNRFSGLSP